MSVKLLTKHNLECLSLKGGCTGSSESTLAKMPHRWKSHDTVQIIVIHYKIIESKFGASVKIYKKKRIQHGM